MGRWMRGGADGGGGRVVWWWRGLGVVVDG